MGFDQVPIYLINLKRREDRLLQMHQRLGRLALSRIDAIDGTDPDARQKEQLDNSAFNAMTASEIACYLSHQKAWRRIVDEGVPFACILEDDVIPGEEFGKFMDSALWSPLAFDCVKLDAWTKPVRISRGHMTIADRGAHRLHSTCMSAAAYMLSQDGARRLLETSMESRCPVDYVLFGEDCDFLKYGSVYQLAPAICMQDKYFLAQPSPSDLEEARSEKEQNRARPETSSKFMRELKRPFIQARHLYRQLMTNSVTKIIEFR